MDTMARLCGSFQLPKVSGSHCFQENDPDLDSGRGQEGDSISLPEAGERKSISSAILRGGSPGAQALQCSAAVYEALQAYPLLQGSFLPGPDL